MSLVSMYTLVSSANWTLNASIVLAPTSGDFSMTSTMRRTRGVFNCSNSEDSAAFLSRQNSISPSGPRPMTAFSFSAAIVDWRVADHVVAATSILPTAASSSAAAPTSSSGPTSGRSRWTSSLS